MSQGTRCRQLAMYVIFDSPFNMLCDSPQHYEAEKESTDFIASVPTVWDETLPVDGKVGDYIVMARRKGDVWYVGGLTDWEKRTVKVDLSFLGEGEWEVELIKDGINVRKNPKDYKIVKEPAGEFLEVEMYSGGGFAAKITRK